MIDARRYHNHKERCSSTEPEKNFLVEEFIQYLQVERNASDHTVIAYRQALEKFILWQRDRSTDHQEFIWRSFTSQTFRLFLMECTKAGMARSYIRLTFAALRSFYEYLVTRGRLVNNPLKGLQLPKMDKRLPVVLSVAQAEELIAAPLVAKRQRQAPAWAASRDTAAIEAILRQRPAPGRTGGAQRYRSGYLYRDRPGDRQRPERANSPADRASAQGNPAIS